MLVEFYEENRNKGLKSLSMCMSEMLFQDFGL